MALAVTVEVSDESVTVSVKVLLPVDPLASVAVTVMTYTPAAEGANAKVSVGVATVKVKPPVPGEAAEPSTLKVYGAVPPLAVIVGVQAAPAAAVKVPGADTANDGGCTHTIAPGLTPRLAPGAWLETLFDVTTTGNCTGEVIAVKCVPAASTKYAGELGPVAAGSVAFA